MRYRMLALDLDGTVLDPEGDLRDGVRDAIAAAAGRGLQVVLCTGRRFRTALPLARRLELSRSIIVNNGVLVKDVGSGETLHHNYLQPEIHAEVLALLRETGPPMVYVDAYHERIDLLTERPSEAHEFQREYLDDNTEFCRVVDDLGAVRRQDVILMSMMADEATLGALRARGERALGNRVRMHSLLNKNYRGQILEFLSPDSGKWSALQTIAAEANIDASEIAAIGDDANDVEMLSRVGLGIAMGNAVEAAKAVADHVAGSNAEDGAIEAIERILGTLH
jgi:Cof subfamily protein (haloacid dehalogenase superfamily)